MNIQKTNSVNNGKYCLNSIKFFLIKALANGSNGNEKFEES